MSKGRTWPSRKRLNIRNTRMRVEKIKAQLALLGTDMNHHLELTGGENGEHGEAFLRAYADVASSVIALARAERALS